MTALVHLFIECLELDVVHELVFVKCKHVPRFCCLAIFFEILSEMDHGLSQQKLLVHGTARVQLPHHSPS